MHNRSFRGWPNSFTGIMIFLSLHVQQRIPVRVAVIDLTTFQSTLRIFTFDHVFVVTTWSSRMLMTSLYSGNLTSVKWNSSFVCVYMSVCACAWRDIDQLQFALTPRHAVDFRIMHKQHVWFSDFITAFKLVSVLSLGCNGAATSFIPFCRQTKRSSVKRCRSVMILKLRQFMDSLRPLTVVDCGCL